MRFESEGDILPLCQLGPVSLSKDAAENLRRFMIACLGGLGERNQIYPQTYEN